MITRRALLQTLIFAPLVAVVGQEKYGTITDTLEKALDKHKLIYRLPPEVLGDLRGWHPSVDVTAQIFEPLCKVTYPLEGAAL